MNIPRNSFLALLGLAMIGTSHANPTSPGSATGPYVSLAGGALWLEDASAFGVTLDFDTGFSILGAVGFAFGNGLAFELESGYMEVDSAQFSFRGFHGDVGGEFQQVPIMGNVVYTFDLVDRVSIYIGGGAGIVWSDASVDSVAGFRIPAGLGNVEDEWNFAAQAKAGVSFQLSDAASLNVGYRYFYGKDAVGGLDDAQGSVLEGGITFRF